MRRTRWIGIASLVGSAVVAAVSTRRMFRHDMEDISAQLEAGSKLVGTDFGCVEYGREGRGPTVLVVHGAGGGYDQGLLVGRELFGPDYDVIAPSRFGYLRTDLPAGHQPCAQADAHCQLLDRLEVDKAVVLGISAGAPSAIEMALRQPDRVSALILVVPRAYAPGIEVTAEKSAENRPILKMIMKGQDFAFWLATKFARRRLMHFLGVPREVYDNADPLEQNRLDWIVRNILPLSKRVPGIVADGDARIEPWPLERIEAPTLVVSAADDLFNTAPAARFTAEHIAGAELMIAETGGHLLSGRTAEIRARIADFLRRRLSAPRKATA